MVDGPLEPVHDVLFSATFFSSLQITDSQADTLEYQVAEALQDLIAKNARNNEIEDIESNDQETRGEQDDQGSDANRVKFREGLTVMMIM